MVTEHRRAQKRRNRKEWAIKNPEKAKEMYREKSRRRRLKDPERDRLEQKRWRELNPDKTKAHRLKAKYKMSKETYDAMLIKQSGMCAANGCQPTSRGLFVDHDHVTGKIRGLLCQHCNTALGHAKDNVDILIGLARYLASHSG